MQVIEKGDFFKLSTDEQVEAAKEVLKQLRSRNSWRKGDAAQYLYTEEIYKQKKDCKDFIKNLVRARNFEVVSVGRSEIRLTGKVKKKSVVTEE